MTSRMNENLNQWVDEILKSPQNIATKVELQEQSRVAFNLFIEADIDGSETLSVTELKQRDIRSSSFFVITMTESVFFMI